MSLQCVRSSRSQSSDGGVSPYQSPPPYGLGSDGEGVSSPLLYSGSSGSGLNYSVSPVQYTGSDQDDSAYHEPLYYSESSPGVQDFGVYHVNSSEYKFQVSIYENCRLVFWLRSTYFGANHLHFSIKVKGV